MSKYQCKTSGLPIINEGKQTFVGFRGFTCANPECQHSKLTHFAGREFCKARNCICAGYLKTPGEQFRDQERAKVEARKQGCDNE